MEFILADKNKALIDAWKQNFNNVPHVKIYEGSILDLHADCLVSPANSFGFMDGGLDLVISQNYGWDIQKKLQIDIQNYFSGELLIGQGHVISMPDITKGYKYLLSAPTMRIPMVLQGNTTVSPNVYLAMKAILTTIKSYNSYCIDQNTPENEKIHSIVIPGLGSGAGRVSPEVCADKMRLAFDDFWQNKYLFPKTLTEAALYNKKCTTVTQAHTNTYKGLNNFK